MSTDELDTIAERLSDCRSLLFVTGAGVSADSGLPTYRGIGGLYRTGTTEDGMPIEVALSGEMFRRSPERTWKHIAEIERACRGALPNRGHRVIAALEERFERVTVLTQNVDGLHARAGSRDVIDVHGDVRRIVCTVCEHGFDVEDYSELDIPPRCGACGGLMRPRVVLFGEMLHAHSVAALERALLSGYDAVFSVGTTSVFPYIAQPVVDASRRGALTVEINPGESEVSTRVDHALRAGAAQALDELADRLGL